jgi:endonuclease G
MQFDIDGYNDTFYTSNISPQDHEFNAGLWNRLEQKSAIGLSGMVFIL